MDRNVLLSEMIKEMQVQLETEGDCELRSVGTSSGTNSAFIFHTKRNGMESKDITIKCTRK